ncbi:phosphatidate cytidylyltransferase [Formosimonas limnophila]|uniref:Phosphatidate cytidylyltransferase n=1 Tax=Formosimonas limnophila TaxID=1384487 RepID=A0A8J3CKZ2_9BURK|nr:phosphatidate cytidylyltransferase [Formosimonas limnophila]GHA71403.1 phosphatidate cytidylyltransferase [Formosimonas limnophila]
MNWMDWDDYERFWIALIGMVLLVGIAHIVVYVLLNKATANSLKVRRAFLLRCQRHLSAFWWVFLVSALVSVFGITGALIVCAVISFLGLREFVTLSPVKIGDHRALSFAFFVFLPLQYVLIAFSEFGFFTVLIPVYAFLLLPIFSIVRQDTEKFLSRKASLQWGLMIAVYCLSHTVAILQIAALDKYSPHEKTLFLLFFLVLVRCAMLWQHIADYLMRNRVNRIAHEIHSRMTWNGLLISAIANALIAAAFVWITPFTVWQAAIAGSLISVSSVFGRLVMRGITRSLGVRDWADLTGGQQGVLDRLDAILYAAPVLFHYTLFVTTR